MRFSFFEGKIVPFEQAKVSVMTHGFNYGTACLEGIRGYWHKDLHKLILFRIEDHFNRLLESSKVLKMRIGYSTSDLIKISIELLKMNDYREDLYLRPLVYKSDLSLSVQLSNLKSDIALYVFPFGDYLDTQGGVKVKISHWRKIPDMSIPSHSKICGSYVNSALASDEAKVDGFHEAILLSHDGYVQEGSVENIFIVKNNLVITPPSRGIVKGITRKTVLDFLKKDLHIPFEERRIFIPELFQAEEVFLTGTGAKILPVINVNNISVGNGEKGPITKKIQDLYFEVVQGNYKKYQSWLTPISFG